MGCNTKKNCLVLSASELRHQIKIEQVTESPDGYGGYTSAWTTFKTVWAAINPLKAWEQAISLQNQTRTTHKISMRYEAGITAKMRVNFNGRYFNIRSIINREEANVTLDLMADEGLAS